MTRYLCPVCEGGGVFLLDDNLECCFCKGHYIWAEGTKRVKNQSNPTQITKLHKGETMNKTVTRENPT